MIASSSAIVKLKINNLYNKLLIDLIDEYFPNRKIKILDVGCGNGDAVQFLLDAGYDAYGVDVKFKLGKNIEKLTSLNRVKRIDIDGLERIDIDENFDYIWPDFGFEFDLIVSKAVIEHVKNIQFFSQESHRFLKQGGLAVHYFPSMYALVEPHTGIFFGGFIRSKAWFFMLCSIGLCFKRYRNNGIAALNYMSDFTSYRHDSEIIKSMTDSGFLFIGYQTKKLISNHPNKFLFNLSKIHFFVSLFQNFRSKVMVFEKN